MDVRAEENTSPLPMIVGIIGGALMIIGSFLAWATVSIDATKFAAALGVDPGLLQGAIGDTSQSFSGTKGNDGYFTLVAGLVVIALAVVLLLKADLGKVLGGLMIVAGVIGAGVALYDLSQVNNVKNDALGGAAGALQGAGIDPSVLDGVIKVGGGIGIWVCILGGLVAIVAGIMALMRKGASTPAMATTTGVPGPMEDGGFGSTMPPPAPTMSTPPAPQPPEMGASSVPETPPTPDVSASDIGPPSSPEPPSSEPPSAPDTGSGESASPTP